MTSCAQAIKIWEAKNETKADEAVTVKLYCQLPSITKLDSSLNSLKNCEHLSLSTNSIDKMISLSSLKKLRILSLGRNSLKKIEKLDDNAETLEQLWLSYNQISTLDGLANLSKLTTLYLANNNIKNWSELDKIQSLAELRDVTFIGNPIYSDVEKKEPRIEVLRHVPQVSKIDGKVVTPAERELAAEPIEQAS